jgi:hypothetical protein
LVGEIITDSGSFTFEFTLGGNFLVEWGGLQQFAAAFHGSMPSECAVRTMPVIKELSFL